MANTIVTQANRTELVEIATYIADHPNSFNYEEIRPIPRYTSFAALQTAIEKGVVIETDCSGSTTMIFEAAGLRDPNGFDYDGAGNTTSLYNYLPKIASFSVPESIDFTNVHVGTLLMFDAPPENLAHVCIVTKPNGINPEVYTFGSNPPRITDFDSERLGHPGQTVSLLAISGLGTTLADPYHYEWFDDSIKQQLTYSKNTERAVVENYDHQRLQPTANKASLQKIEVNLADLITRLENVMKAGDPKGTKYHRAWRLAQLKERAAGKQVVS